MVIMDVANAILALHSPPWRTMVLLCGGVCMSWLRGRIGARLGSPEIREFSPCRGYEAPLMSHPQAEESKAECCGRYRHGVGLPHHGE